MWLKRDYIITIKMIAKFIYSYEFREAIKLEEKIDAQNIQNEAELLKQFVKDGHGDGDGESDVAPVVVTE